MGAGDELMASGMARGAAARGKRAAFGDGKRIIWGPHCSMVFQGNPNIAPPGSEGADDLEWVDHYKGHRRYNSQDGDKWRWNMEFRPQPGEFFFTHDEGKLAKNIKSGFVFIEPNVPAHKKVAHNKQWPPERYQVVADRLRRDGLRIVQPIYRGARYSLQHVERVRTSSFRDAMAILSSAALYIGAEGGLHHGAAALGVRAVVLFGGFIPPEVTGYSGHANMAAGGPACGTIGPCAHCRDAMNAITAEDVYKAAREQLRREPDARAV